MIRYELKSSPRQKQIRFRKNVTMLAHRIGMLLAVVAFLVAFCIVSNGDYETEIGQVIMSATQVRAMFGIVIGTGLLALGCLIIPGILWGDDEDVNVW